MVAAMALWDKLKQELDRAGHAAQEAIDEGRVRLDVLRARKLADKAAQGIGYALYRARQRGQDLDPETYAQLSSALAAHEAEAARLEERLESWARARRSRRAHDASPPPSEPPAP